MIKILIIVIFVYRIFTSNIHPLDIYFVSVLDLVVEGQTYGPPDHICKKKVEFQRKCGHTTSMDCYDAFEQATFGGQCSENVEIINPECGHTAKVSCFKKQQLESKGLVHRPPIKIVHEGANQFGTSVLHTKCEYGVTVVRKCGHQTTVKCHLSHDKHLQECKEMITVQNKFCLHDVKIPCSMSILMNTWEPWGKGHQPLLQGNVLCTTTIAASCMPPTQLVKYVDKCKETINVQRDFCQHGFEMKCNEVVKKLINHTLLNEKCVAKIEKAEMKCGHTKDYKCFEYQEYLKDPSKTNCREEVHLTCWNYKICGSVIKSTCNKTGEQLSCKIKSTWICSNKHSFEKVDLCQKGFPSQCPACIVKDIGSYAAELHTMNPQDLVQALPNVPQELVSYELQSVYTSEMLEAFIKSQINSLKGFEKWAKNEPPWKRPLPNCRIAESFFPCFRYGSVDLNIDFTTYLKVGSLHGVQLCEWTLNNIEKLIRELTPKKKHVCLLFGVVFCCRVLVDPADYPGGKDKQHKKQDWVKKKRSQGFSVLQHNKMNGWDHLIVWDPYPMMATHKGWVSVQNLQEIVSAMKQQSSPPTRALLKPKFQEFKIPEDTKSQVAMVTYEEETNEEEHQEENKSSNGKDQGRIVKWDGVSLGRPNIFDEHAQMELMKKLQFCITASGYVDFILGSH